MTLSWHHLAACGSTNDEALRLGRAGAPEGTAVTALEQTRGRGRRGHTWYSPPGENLYLSVVFRPPLRPDQAPLMTLCAGVALSEALRGVLRGAGEVSLKWPNDVLVACGGGPARKLAGVLTEMVCTGGAVDFVVVGIGVNVQSLSFPDELREHATSLRLCLPDAADPPELPVLAEQIAGHLFEEHRRYIEDGAGPLLLRFAERARSWASGWSAGPG